MGKGGYYVVAVDVAGRESAPSDQVGVEEPEEEEEVEEVEETVKPAEPSKEEKRKNRIKR